MRTKKRRSSGQGGITQPRRRAVDWLYYEPMDLAA
jgi:hypothetical protein